MKNLTLEQMADFLETATIERSHDAGHAIVHVGKNAVGARFVMVNDHHGKTALTEAM